MGGTPATHGVALAAAPRQRSPGSRFVRLRSRRPRPPNGFARWLPVVAIAPPLSPGGASRAGSPSAVVRRSPSIASSWRRLNRRSPAWARVAWPTGSLPAGNRDAHAGALQALVLSLVGHVALGQFGPSTPASPISPRGGSNPPGAPEICRARYRNGDKPCWFWKARRWRPSALPFSADSAMSALLARVRSVN